MGADPAGGGPIPLGDGGVSVGSHVLSRLSVSVLSYLSAHPGASGAGVARELGVRHPSQVLRLLERLEARGLVARGPDGRGGELWSLSSEGRRLLNEVRPVWSPQVSPDARAGLASAGEPPGLIR